MNSSNSVIYDSQYQYLIIKPAFTSEKIFASHIIVPVISVWLQHDGQEIVLKFVRLKAKATSLEMNKKKW